MAPDVALGLPGLTKVQHLRFKAYLDRENSKEGILPHDVLLEMGQGGLRDCFIHENVNSYQTSQVQRIWHDLMTTTKSTAVTDRHLTAACNAMCVFLDCVCSSKSPDVKQFGLSKETWLNCFRVILDSFGEGKAKPMRQVLLTLTNILKHHPDQDLSRSILDTVMSDMAGIVLLGDTGHLKAALVTLDLFIRKVATFHGALLSIDHCLNVKQVEWSRRLKLLNLESVLDPVRNPHDDSAEGNNASEQRASSSFVVALMISLLSKDSQSAAVTFFKSFSTALIASGKGHYLYTMSLPAQLDPPGEERYPAGQGETHSPWIPLVQCFLKVHRTAVNVFSDFLFPLLFKIDPIGYDGYLNSIQEDGLDLVNVLAVVQVACHMGLETDPASTLAGILQNRDVRLEGPTNVFNELLSHRDADVRTRTFALLLASSSTIAPLPNTSMQCLMDNMKYLYGDSDSQSRGEVMSAVRKMVLRLRAVAYALHRTLHSFTNGSLAAESSDTSTELHRQESFLTWYIGFLEDELSPTASYQRHIMALKSMEILIRSGLDRKVAEKHRSEIVQDQTQWPFHVSLHSPSITYVLLNLLLDPFEDVRAASSLLLKFTLDCVCRSWSSPASYTRTPDIRGSQCLCFEGSNILLPEVSASRVASMVKSGRSKELDHGLTCTEIANTIQPDLRKLATKADILASKTNRADHADGAARLFDLCYSLAPDVVERNVVRMQVSKLDLVDEIISPVETALACIGDSLDAPVEGFSLHTHILGLRYILGNPNFSNSLLRSDHPSHTVHKGAVARILNVCQGVWAKVSKTLCVDSLGNSTDDADEDLIAGPKDLLSYSWRALRDSSLLLRAFLDNSIFQKQISSPHLKRMCIERIGALCMDQLSHIRHRGAFSTVAQTFSILCQRIADSTDPSTLELRDVWYEDAIATIDRQATKLTRRSAGLPAMIAGLLTSCPRPFLNDFLASFRRRATDFDDSLKRAHEDDYSELQLPQVHALNCLREVFTNAKFRVMTEPHVMDMLRISARALSCGVWAIRNCGLMLFRACTSRLGKARSSPLAGHDTVSWRNEGNVSIDRSPEVLELAIQLLDPLCFSQASSEHDAISASEEVHSSWEGEKPPTVATERVFAALDLLGRLALSEEDWSRIKPLLVEQMSSSVWQIRAQAARVVASGIAPWNSTTAIKSLINGTLPHSSQNKIHGHLLCIGEILRKSWHTHGMVLQTWDKHSAAVSSIISTITERYHMSPVVRSLFIDVQNDVLEREFVLHHPEEGSPGLPLLVHGIVGDDNRPVDTSRENDTLYPIGQSIALQDVYRIMGHQFSQVPSQDLPIKLRRRFDDLAKEDQDSAAHLVQQLSSPVPRHPIVRHGLDKLFLHIFANHYPDDIKVEAITGLVSSVERGQFSHDLSTDFAETSQLLLSDVRHDSRELFIAKLRLKANLLVISSEESPVSDCRGKGCMVCEWTSVLQEAAGDEIDLPTRLGAASSLLAITPRLLSAQTAASIPFHHLPIYMTLYDLLNDDDEDVREIAGSATSRILSTRETDLDHYMELLPQAASEKLARFLSGRWRDDSRFTLTALKRICPAFMTNHIGNTSHMSGKRASVKTFLERTQENSTVLFEEERQNLYIDDFRGVEIWFNVLKVRPPPALDCRRWLEDWVLASLKDLSEYLDDTAASDGPLGATSQLEVFMLFMQVVHLAGVLLRWARATSGVEENSAARTREADILQEAKILAEQGQRLCIHGRIIRSLDQVLEGQ